MILYEGAPAPAVRAGELDLAGRRLAARAIAYSGEIGPPAFRFDPVERRLHVRSPSGTLLAGPFSALEWSDAFARVPRGPVLVSGAASAEEVRGSFRAAAEGAHANGRGVYLLDPEPGGIPSVTPGRPTAAALVALFSWSPERPFDGNALAAARARGVPAGVVWPVIPGWTGEADFWDGYLDGAADAGASFAVPLAPMTDPEFRRIAVEARTRVSPEFADSFFETIHHEPWLEALPDRVLRAREAVERRGLSALPPRPAGLREPLANWGAAAHLEERAAALASSDEHQAALLLAAVRWIDACGRDLRPIVAEGNFARAFPFSRDLARETEDALREAARVPEPRAES
jgi:hypothetical protein